MISPEGIITLAQVAAPTIVGIVGYGLSSLGDKSKSKNNE